MRGSALPPQHPNEMTGVLRVAPMAQLVLESRYVTRTHAYTYDCIYNIAHTLTVHVERWTNLLLLPSLHLQIRFRVTVRHRPRRSAALGRRASGRWITVVVVNATGLAAAC